MNSSISRRQFLGTTAAAVTVAAVSPTVLRGSTDTPALLGGTPVRRQPFPSWPKYSEREERALLDVLHSGKWFRGDGSKVDQFESAYAQLTGARYCIATANGTSALIASLAALEVGPGDEVILPPYTFVATLNVVFLQYAVPVFVDTDPETFQIDARKVEAAITARTKAILPVHIGGSAADLDTLVSVGKRHKLPVIEDACQAHLAEWRGRKVGTLGDTGCFSFQASKNLNSGEGGAILTHDEALADKCCAFHNHNRARSGAGRHGRLADPARTSNLRLTEFQAGLLLAQMTRLEVQSRTRDQNAQSLSGMLREIPGIVPARLHDGCTRCAWHLYMFRYQKEQFAGLDRAKFLRALHAEGVPASGGYGPMNKDAFITETFRSRAYQRLYPPAELAGWAERNQCPENDRLCQEAVWFTQPMLLGTRSDMDDIVAAIRKIQAHAGELARS
ncbi:MAG: DegT/DnrJ/EryC1/StrS family aminotransferase [Verrucomicrobia bacterium]|nr:DegT/DnrJ/EryC1/StrS family aminotransferase [Verrucomicrobiota bacterium]